MTQPTEGKDLSAKLDNTSEASKTHEKSSAKLDNTPAELEDTSAVLFDPFADDEDEEEVTAPGAFFTAPNVVTAPSITAPGTKPTATSEMDSGERSRREALSTFRQLRGTHREGARVAGGMVQLPFITPTNPQSTIVDPQAEGDTDYEPPTLKKGDMVANQYEILGPIAHGGLGWIYLATDHNVADRWVVLKGLMATENEHERAVAESERAFLADITHPGIVKIFNFIDDPRSPGGFIVMEFLGGPSLRSQKKKQPKGVFDIDIAIAYILEILPALDYLHSRGVVYNDLKPDNIIITEDQVKLIDLGAVTGVGAFGHIFGTKGFQAPEIATTGPTVASDIYTVGRTLASLIISLPVQDGAYSPGLPTPDDEPLFRHYLSLYRFLLRATHENPDRRFESASDMAHQLVGVLREVLAIRDGKHFPNPDTRFSTHRTTFGTKHMVFRTDQLIDGIERSAEISTEEVVASLPTPLPDPNDSGAALLSAASLTEPSELLDTLTHAYAQPEMSNSAEIPLTIARAQLDLGMTAEARDTLSTLEEEMHHDWRHQWFSGITYLLLEDFHAAQEYFNHVLNILPGELAPKLALAATDELLLQQIGKQNTKLMDSPTLKAATALAYTQNMRSEDYKDVPGWNHITDDPVALRFHTMRLYGLVWATNQSTISAAFGLARQLMAENLNDMAVNVLDRVPQVSRHRRLARLTSILILVSGEPEELKQSNFRRAARRLDLMPTNEPRLPQIRLAVLASALRWLRFQEKNPHPARIDSTPLLGVPFTQRGIRFGLEKGLRYLGRQSNFQKHRFRLIDMANQIRPRTWF